MAMSKGNANDVVMEVNLSYAECPVCYTFLQAPIILCSEGHSICNMCRNELDTCPLCQKAFLQLRNFALESLLENVKIPCSYENLGCPQKLRIKKRDIHASLECDYKPYPCIYCNCKTPLVDLENHLVTCEERKDFKTVFRSVEKEANHGSLVDSFVSFTVEGNVKEVVITKVGSLGMFIQRCTKNGPVWYFWTNVVKSEKEAEKYRCEMLLTSRTGIVLSYTGPVHSLHSDTDKVINEGYCLTVTDKILQEICQENGKFVVTLAITLKENVHLCASAISMLEQMHLQKRKTINKKACSPTVLSNWAELFPPRFIYHDVTPPVTYYPFQT